MIDVREAKAGAAINEACAKIVGQTGYRVRHTVDGVMRTQSPRDYSGDISLAWRLVEMMEHAAWDVTVRVVVAQPDECTVWRKDDEITTFANTVPLAICRAFLLAYDVTEI